MNGKRTIGIFGISALLSISSGAFAEDSTSQGQAQESDRTAEPASADHQKLQSIYELIKSGAIVVNERGELVVKRSLTDILMKQGRLNHGNTEISVICEKAAE